MKLGLLTAAFPGLTLGEVAEWAGANGFDTLEIACWPAGSGEQRRYAGVSHIDAEHLDASGALAIREMLAARELDISSLAYYPNHLHPDPDHRAGVGAHLDRVIDAAVLLGVEVVGTFVGADPARSLTENLRSFAELWPPIVERARGKGVKIAIENCPMLFSDDEWPFGTNLARTPHIWREMFNVIPEGGFGLNLDPSHLVWQMIDYERVVYDFADRILHVHAKDMEIDRGGLQEHGVLGAGLNWQVPRLPGLGEVRWDRFLAALYAVGYDHVVSIEHEDRAFEGDDELVKRGFLIARNALRPYIA
jgi:sugar phosphate isomerase/epimerase